MFEDAGVVLSHFKRVELSSFHSTAAKGPGFWAGGGLHEAQI